MLPCTIAAFRRPRFLERGTPTQRAAWKALQSAAAFEILRPFDVRLAGTIPIDVDIEGSDLDLLCEVHHPQSFAKFMESQYGGMHGFHIRYKANGVVVIRFVWDGFPVEVYGAPRPVERQRAWVHMVAEWHLLRSAGQAAHEGIRRLKRQGLKTEPAFAHYFKMPGDPYEVLYRLGWALLAEEARDATPPARS